MKVISAEFDKELPRIYNPQQPQSASNKIYKAISSSDIEDDHGIYHLPQAIGFYNYSTNVPTQTPLNAMEASIDNSIAAYGYAVVTLHPQDFAVKDASNTPTNAVDPKEMSDLNSLITYILKHGYVLKDYQQVVKSLSTPASP
jgi:hypothetical protein